MKALWRVIGGGVLIFVGFVVFVLACMFAVAVLLLPLEVGFAVAHFTNDNWWGVIVGVVLAILEGSILLAAGVELVIGSVRFTMKYITESFWTRK